MTAGGALLALAVYAMVWVALVAVDLIKRHITRRADRRRFLF